MENETENLLSADFQTYDLVCLSHLRWDFVYQRPQHLLSRLARGRRVGYGDLQRRLREAYADYTPGRTERLIQEALTACAANGVLRH